MAADSLQCIVTAMYCIGNAWRSWAWWPSVVYWCV